MPVDLIIELPAIRPNHEFIILQKRDLHVLDGQFRRNPILKPHGRPDVITVLLRLKTQFWDGQLSAAIVFGSDGDMCLGKPH